MMHDLDLLRFVFSFHVLDRIVHADDVVDPAEIAFVVERFPRSALEERGLIDERNCLTARYRDLLAEALVRLPAELDDAQKLKLIDGFFDGAAADGRVVKPEKRAIRMAVQLLGIPPELVHHRLHDLDTHSDEEEAGLKEDRR